MSVSQYEAEVVKMLDEGRYDIDIGLRLLRTYFLLQGTVKHNKQVVVGFLLRSIAEFVSNDFGTCLCLFPNRVQEQQLFKAETDALVLLDDAIRKGEFEQFWTLWEEKKVLFPPIPQFVEITQKAMAKSIARTFKSISEKEVVGLLGPDANVAVLLAPFAAQISKGEVAFPSDCFNDPKTVKAEDDAVTLKKIIPICSF